MKYLLSNRKLRKITLILATVAFLWIGLFGLLFPMGEMKANGEMSGCLFNGQMEVCAMNFLQHIALWQAAISSLPQNTKLLEILILASVAVALSLLRSKSLAELFEPKSERARLYLGQSPRLKIFNYLREAFSQGILNSKTYHAVI